jgi:hypothetical protein
MTDRDTRRGSILDRAYVRAAAVADRVDERHTRRSPLALTPGHAGAVAATWGTLKLATVALLSPIAGPIVLAGAARGTRHVVALTLRYPGMVRDLVEGRPIEYAADRVARAPARARYFVSSDLHRCVPGTVDWTHHQGTAGLYDAVLDYYADREWSLVENGDVEDFWLSGGSTYGVVYDVFRLASFAAGKAKRAVGRRGAGTHADASAGIAVHHLRRIVANNRRTYDRIDQRFHRYGRYHRLVGNHDDVFLDPAMVEALGEVHHGIAVNDFLLLVDDADDRAVGVVTHGHHTDGWNMPFRSALGRLGTWLGSALLDVPFASNPGIPDLEESSRLLEGRLPDVLTRVSRRFGANRELYSLDEILLFDAWRSEWSPADGAVDELAESRAVEPWLLLGHTHVPLVRPLDPESGAAWSRYANSGSGIFYECLTGVEWDGTTDPANPSVRLVGWRYADRDDATPPSAIVAWDGDRGVVREVFERVEPSECLQVVARGHDRRPVDA